LTRKDLWATPVWEVDTGLSNKFNADLLAEINKIQSGPGTQFNIWNYHTESINTLRTTILNTINEAIKQDMPSFVQQRLSLNRGWVNFHRTGESLATHSHGGVAVVCTYYIKSPPNCGDLLLIDPRGGVNWGWENEGNIVGVRHVRIKPKEGTLVFFPGFILHSVDYNRSPQPRISLSSNLILK